MIRAANPNATLKTSARTRTGALSWIPNRKASERVWMARAPESITGAAVPKGKMA